MPLWGREKIFLVLFSFSPPFSDQPITVALGPFGRGHPAPGSIAAILHWTERRGRGEPEQQRRPPSLSQGLVHVCVVCACE
jgi:hypothetical protein